MALCTSWSAQASDWEFFKHRFITAEGRVVDWSDSREITTSEGQSYALFFALVHNDRELFQKLLDWTQTHLAQGDLGAHLPAWLWGKNEENHWKILDTNSASDSDLWIAYSLLEAGRLWEVREYTLLAHLLLQNVAEQETAILPHFGRVLLPGAKGFTADNAWRLNPSYTPPQLIERIRTELPNHPIWADIANSLPFFLMQTAPLGIAPDWVTWEGNTWNWNSNEIASYDAIRVYLWIGMLNSEFVFTSDLHNHFIAALAFINNDELPAEYVNVVNGQQSGTGPMGFSAALLPLFSNTSFGAAQRARLHHIQLEQLGYYSFVLLLFGKGWDEAHYAFSPTGYLQPNWQLNK